MRKNYVIATAGHVDHGKTTFIKAMTGKDCDSHIEEKQRGITIHLGFSYIKLSDEIFAGIIDVPGHKDFIDTMISGINGIDLVLFIVSADEGFMPQSYEHLQVLKILGVKKGIIILTKCDLVDEETIFFAIEEIKDKTRNSFLENAQIVQTSAISGIKIDDIKSLILTELVKEETLCLNNKNFITIKDNLDSCFQMDIDNGNSGAINDPFRFYPDRFFQIKGIGSIVTGTVLNGTLTKNKPLYMIPRNKELRIRKMEAYDHEVNEIKAGQRASLNVVNFEKEDFYKGVMFSEKLYYTTSLIDTQLTLFNVSKPFEIWTTVAFYSATIQAQARIHLMDKDKLFSEETCFAQIHLEKAVSLCINDRFIIRNTSNDITLGGGLIIDTLPLHHRRRTQKVKNLLTKRVSGKLVDLLCTEVAKTTKPISFEQISNKLFKKIEFVEINTNNIDFLQYDNWYWTKTEQEHLEKKIIRFLQVAHKNNPLEQNGKLIEDFFSIIPDFPEASKSIIIKNVLNLMKHRSILEIREGTYALASHKVVLSHKDHGNINWIDQFILNQRMKTPLMSQIIERAKDRDIDEKRLKQMLFYLIAKKRIVHFHGEYLHVLIINPIRQKLLEYLYQNHVGITVAEFRNLVHGNRKICLLLLNIFDNEGITIRIEDKRFISEKGIESLKIPYDNNLNYYNKKK